MAAKLWHEGGRLVHAKINGGPHAGSGSAHGCANELEESQVPPFKGVISHDNGHGLFDGFQREVAWQFALPVELIQPFPNYLQSMLCVYVGVHGTGVGSEEPDVGRESSSSLQPFELGEELGTVFFMYEDTKGLNF